MARKQSTSAARGRPARYLGKSTRMGFRLTPEVHGAIQAFAATQGCTLSDAAEALLRRGLGLREQQGALKAPPRNARPRRRARR